MTSNLQHNMDLLDMIEDDEKGMEDLDAMDFNWMDDNALINIAMDYDNVKRLTEDGLHDLTFELARRLDSYLKDADPFEDA